MDKVMLYREYIKAVKFEREASHQYNTMQTSASKMVLEMARRQLVYWEDLLHEQGEITL